MKNTFLWLVLRAARQFDSSLLEVFFDFSSYATTGSTFIRIDLRNVLNIPHYQSLRLRVYVPFFFPLHSLPPMKREKAIISWMDRSKHLYLFTSGRDLMLSVHFQTRVGHQHNEVEKSVFLA